MGLFREYDLRGIVGQELTDSIAEQVGRAYCTYVKDRGSRRFQSGEMVDSVRRVSSRPLCAGSSPVA